MKRNKFSLSHYKLGTYDMGKLYPIGIIDVLPGDTIQQATTALVRMQPMLAPVMHPIHVKIHHWFVPYRLLWDDFEDMITGEQTPEFPTITSDFSKHSLGDHFGLSGNQEVSALPFRAYQLIWNEFYRDQDLQTELTNTTESGADTETNLSLLPVSWRKDYFTTARPWTQKGSEITVPVGGPGVFNVTSGLPYVTSRYGSYNPGTQTPFDVTGSVPSSINSAINDNTSVRSIVSNTNGSFTKIDETAHYGSDNTGSSSANYSFVQGVRQSVSSGNPASGSGTLRGSINFSDGGISINELRLALALQRYEEARAKYGSRYVEYLRYLGIRSSDARLQLPEYLGGGKQVIQISEVLNTTANDTALGSMAGHGISAMRSNRYRRFFEEHGVIISLMYIMPEPMYIQGTNRMWLKRTKEDFFQKELQHIGMQEVYTRELYGTATDDLIFGYQDRYDEYRRNFSNVSGDFRDTLDFWHLGRKFDSAPVLNSDFISNAPTKRIFAEQTENEFLVMANHSIQARRMLKKIAKTATF